MAQVLLSIEALRIEALQSSAGKQSRPLVEGITISVERGEVLGLIGESGAGKSTVALAAMGYVRPGCVITGGRVVFDGCDLSKLSPSELRALRGARVAYVAQSAAASFNPALSIGRQVAEAIVVHRSVEWSMALRRAAALFEELDLPDPSRFGARFPHQVSGGQLQRAIIAMAMACEPELLVLDEPTTALDVTTQIEVLASIRALLRRRGSAGLYITHDIAVVAQLADKLAVLRQGRLVEIGSTQSILESPADPYTRRLVAARTDVAFSQTDAVAEVIPPILAVRAVSVGYRSNPNVLREVSLAVNRGESLAVVGSSGSGKSTLARVICGLMAPQDGAVELGGQQLPRDFRQRTRDQLRRIQLISQMPDTALNPRQKVQRIIGRAVTFYFGGGRAAVRNRIGELLEMVGLPRDFGARFPGELSGGQKQRVCIARALAAKPDVIVCDEVTSALDPLVAEEILQLLDGLRLASNTGLIFITHDIGVVRRMANEIAVLDQGCIAASGPISRVFSPPLHPRTEVLLKSVPQLRTGWLSDILRERTKSN